MNLVNQEHRSTGQFRARFRRAVRPAVVLALAVFAGLAMGVAPAQAGPVGTYSLPVWQNVHTDRCLADSFGGGLQTLACIDHPTQNWDWVLFTNGTWLLANSHTDRCLADSFGGGLQTLACISHPTQRWS